MRFSEKVLYHQIHPLKLGTDFVFAFVSLYFFWQHQLTIALILHFAPPVLASFFVIALADLEPQRHSSFGRYTKRVMTRRIEAVRFAGDIVMILGGWYHSYAAIIAGILIVLAAWLSSLHSRKKSEVS
jgi:hypothetical protein